MRISQVAPVRTIASLLIYSWFSLWCGGAQAASQKLSDLLVALSMSRGDAVGRAARVQSCESLRGNKIVTGLVLQYDDARVAHNARIDAWIFGLKSKELTTADLAAESERLGVAQKKVSTFSSAAQSALLRAGCPIKVFWPVLGSGVALFALDRMALTLCQLR